MNLKERQGACVFYPWTAQKNASPLWVKNAKGIWLELEDGQKVMDLVSSVYNANLGHDHPGMKEVILRAATHACVTHPSLVHEEKVKLGENLARLTPGDLSKTFICLSGAEANENAIKMARLYTGKYKIITRYRSYHGATLNTLSMSGDYRRIPFEPLYSGVIRFPDPYERGSGQKIDTVRLLEEIIEIEGPHTIAAILLEGITGANGVFLPEPDYFKRILKLCERYDILLIADEVFSGFGRTGKWFGINHFDTTPHMMTLAKGITAGYAPLGAVVVSKPIADYFENETLWCGLTNYGFAFNCAIANGAIEMYEKENIIEKSHQTGLFLKEQLITLKKAIPSIVEIRSIGMLAAIEFEKPLVDLQKVLLKQGLLAQVRFSTLILAPPLIMTKAELLEAMQTLKITLENFFHLN